MPPRGKAKAKKEVEENGKERQVRQSRNVKAASYKDLSDSEDEKPIRKRSKKETDSESMSEEEKPKARGKKGRRAPARSKKVDVSDSDEGSEFASSASSAEESSKRRKGGRKPTRSLRGNQNTSYKDLSDSEEESVEDEDSLSEKEKKSPPKRGRGRPAAKKSKKEESSDEDEEEEKEDVDDEAEADSGEDEKEKSKTGKPKPKPKSATADSSTDKNAKDKSDNKETLKEDTDKKPRPEHELSDEEEEEDEEDEEEKSSKKGKDDKGKPFKKGKDEEKDSKKRSRADKNGEAATDVKESEPQAKKAKVDNKPALLNKTDTDYDSIDFTSNAKTKDGELWNFKISSWNVAGLKAWIKKNGLDYIKHENPDILCLQETKCAEQKLPPEAVFEGYEAYWLSGEKEGQAGVAILSKTKPLEVKYGIDKPEFDVDGRVITAEYEKFYLVNTYVPNAGRDLKTLPRRLEWDPAFRAYLKNLDEKKPVILCGDLNVAHSEIDLAHPKTNQKTAGFTPQEREGMTELLKEGFVDTFRSLYPDQTGAYSYWTYMFNSRARNTGWRLDYFITSERFLPNVCDNIIRNEVYGSDHCPIVLLAHV